MRAAGGGRDVRGPRRHVLRAVDAGRDRDRCVMMSGYMLVTAILSGVIRDHTPAGKAGHFQGSG